jgi:hypothetical protein
MLARAEVKSDPGNVDKQCQTVKGKSRIAEPRAGANNAPQLKNKYSNIAVGEVFKYLSRF